MSETHDIEQDLFMKHVREAQAEHGARIPHPNAPLPIPKSAPDPLAALKQREYVFEFKYTDPRGKVWQGTFINQILNIAQRVKVGTIRARMQAGVPVEAFTAETFDLIYILTWMRESFIEKPEWASDLTTLLDEELVQALFEYVQKHEHTFRGRSKPAETGKDKS